MARIGAVLLAAGAASRFGGANKLLAGFNGKPLVRHAAEAVAKAGLDDAVVTTGRDRESVERALDGLGLRFRYNPDWAEGIGGSIAAGVDALASDIDGAFIVPGDMPFLTPGLFKRLTDAFTGEGGRKIVYPATPSGDQRNPVLWPRRFFDRFVALPKHEGGKTLLRSLASESFAVPIEDASVFVDIDTQGDLADATRLSC